MQRDNARQSLAPKRCDQPEACYPDCSKDWRPCRRAGCCLRFVVKSLSAATAVLSDRSSMDRAGYSPRPCWVGAGAPGLASHRQPRCHRAWSLPRPRNLRSPSRCPCPAWPAAHPVSELHPGTTRGVPYSSHFRNANYVRRSERALPGRSRNAGVPGGPAHSPATTLPLSGRRVAVNQLRVC